MKTKQFDEDSQDLKELERQLRASAAAAPAPAQWLQLRDELAERASAQGLVDVAVERCDSPLGPLVLGATAAGLVRLALPVESEAEVLEELARRVSSRVLRAPHAALARARRQLEQYFGGRRRQFDVPLDWQLTRGFRREVLLAAARIPYGATASYGELAAAAGSARAVRAAGSALATNPLPILVPCHRVLPASGALGNYRGGARAKAQLLELEGAR
jgi:methylated-DNA-[protein]-cysteine S-methyltransferase